MTETDSWDVLHQPGLATTHWCTDNIGEAAPGVLSPLAASTWIGAVNKSFTRDVGYAIGAFSLAESYGPGPHEDPVVRMFYGRIAMQKEYLARLGDRMPGATGEATVQQIFGRVPDTMTFAPTRRRYPMIAWKLPRMMLTSPGRVRSLAEEFDLWWREQIARAPGLNASSALAAVDDGGRHFDRSLAVHSSALLSLVQPLHGALAKVVDGAGVGDVGALSGSGGAEMAIIEDIWKASRGAISLERVIANHGFHGPMEGELASRVWRDDPAPLRRMVQEYAKRDEAEDPVERDRLARERLPVVQRAVLAATPISHRAYARFILRSAARNIQLRGVAKRSLLQSLDVMRAAARRAGELLAADGRLADPTDIFYLTLEELRGGVPADAIELTARRRERRTAYEQIGVPNEWRGTPLPLESAVSPAAPSSAVHGVGASPGTVEGIVRVVTDPSFADVEPGDILVAPTTDPSWASIMFLCAALVVDIGGPFSHAAVVARELGLPCVVNTRAGTRVLHDGDRVRVDGATGVVEILST